MSNIFKNAYFGKPYKTRGGDKALLIKILSNGYYFLKEGCIQGYFADKNGCHNDVFGENNNMLDIISEWPEEINETELEELAEREYPYEYYTSLHGEGEAEYKNDLREAFKNGYRKAKQKVYE